MWLEDNRDLEKKVFSDIGVKLSRKLEGGLVNSVYYVELKNGSSGVLRVSDSETEGWVPRKERVILSHFYGVPFFPELISHGEIKELNIIFNLITYFEGKNMNTLEEIPSSKVFLDLGETLGKIHSYHTTKFGFVYDFDNIGADPRVHNSYPGPYGNGFEQHFIPAKGLVEHLVSKGSRFSEQLKRIIVKMESQEKVFDHGECTYNHGDYQFKNFLTYLDRLVGILDFDSFRFGDPASDMHLFLQNCIYENVSSNLVSSFFDGYTNIRPLPHGFYEKGLFYRCYRGVQKVITVPFELRKIPESRHEEYKNNLSLFLDKIVNDDNHLELTRTY